MKGTPGKWRVVIGDDGVPMIRSSGLGRWRDETRTIATLRDQSLLSHEDAELIVDAVSYFRNRAQS